MIKILIWGAGYIANKICENGLEANIEGFIESNRTKDIFRGIKVYGLDDAWPEYDYIIVANSYSDDIYKTCIENEIDISKVIFLHCIRRRVGECNPKILHEILGEKNYTDYCLEHRVYDESFFERDCLDYEKQNVREHFRINRNNLWPIISDKYACAGAVGNYFWQDLWAARLIHKSGVKKHFDIGSRVDGFIAHLLAMEIEVSTIDIRKFSVEIEGLNTIVDDATTLHQIPDDSIESMSALCSLEHFGLGRYGDSVDPEACFRCFQEIQRKLKKSGNLYISLPVGRERLEFNAHRVFYPSTIIECFSNMQLQEFSCTAAGRIEYQVEIKKYDDDKHCGDFRYGLFHFIKP